MTLASRRFDATPLLVVLAPLNAATFSLRRALAWNRGPVVHRDEPKSELFESPELFRRERDLRIRYRLGKLYGGSSTRVYRENLNVLDLLDRHVARDVVDSLGEQRSIRAIDVGSKDFCYAFALARFLERSRGRGGPRPITLTGVELDGHPIYADLHSRKEHGEAFARQVDGADVQYAVADFLEHDAKDIDVLTFFFPFVLEYALLRWGLPRRCFLPLRIFEHAHAMLKPGGVVVVMNHTEAGRERQLEILEACGFEIVSSETVVTRLVDYASDVPERSMTVARKRFSATENSRAA